MSGEIQHPHHLSADTVLKQSKSVSNGLSGAEAEKRLLKYGPNKLLDKKGFSIGLLLLNQFKNWLVIILILAAIVSFIANHMIDMVVIIAVIVINAAIGFIQEYRAERAISGLQQLIVKSAKVLRDGQITIIPSEQIVPGDIMVLEEGDNIPADGRIIYSKNLRTLEAPLTGESVPVSKKDKLLPKDTLLADQKNMVWSGTFVVAGYTKAVVTATGIHTALGDISEALSEIKEKPLDFIHKTNVLARQMAIIAIISALVVFVVGFLIRHYEVKEILLISIAVLVAAVPEGLPAIISIILAIGARRMAKRGAIVRAFHATETLGNVTTILTDKTGTLTYNSLTAKTLYTPGDDLEYTISGEGWLPAGNFKLEDNIVNPENSELLKQLLSIAAISNNADLKYDADDDTYQLIGDPTEGALNVMARKAGLTVDDMGVKKVDDLPFSSFIKLRATLVQEEGGFKDHVIGAPEQLLEKATQFITEAGVVPMTSADKNRINDKIEEWSSKALRVIALAYKKQEGDRIDAEDLNDLVFAGIVGMIDPPRQDVKQSVEKCRKAGIRVIMVTGDHVNTAIAIAKATGIIYKKQDEFPDALTERQLLQLSDEEFEHVISNVSVFARLTPKMKLRIAGTLQASGEIIGMTGDGVNDAPALKQADIGISMGIMGTDVARDNSEIVLSDDNFATIVSAIEEGRIVFANAQRTSFFLVTTNIAESLTLITALALGFPPPLIATQILWLNLVTDSLPALALANEKGHKNVMDHQSMNKRKILSKEVISFLLLNIILMAGLSLFAFQYYSDQGLDYARTAVFIIMASTQLFNVYNLRSLDASVFKLGIFSNRSVNAAALISIGLVVLIIQVPLFAKVFHFQPFDWVDFVVLILASSSILIVGELLKLIRRKTMGKKRN